MNNLEVKTKMSVLQLAIVVIIVSTNLGGATHQELVAVTGNHAWLSLLFGAAFCYLSAVVINRLADVYPDETMVEYLPRLIGRRGAGLALLSLITLFYFQIILTLTGFSRVISFFMFKRTPVEIIQAGMLVVCVYCALQNWGTILRVTQVIFFTAFPAIISLFLLSLINMDIVNFLPLWPLNGKEIFSGILISWRAFGGYLVLLLLLPLVYRKNISLAVGLALGLGFSFLFVLLSLIPVIGVLATEGAKAAPFPILVSIRAIELP